jgi:uncharacterized protein HemX
VADVEQPPEDDDGMLPRRNRDPDRSVLTRREKLVSSLVLFLAVLLGAACLVSQQIQQASYQDQIAAGHAQRVAQENAQAAAEEMKLCKVMTALTKLNPPQGSPTDKSRLYLIAQHNLLDQLGTAIGCK